VQDLSILPSLEIEDIPRQIEFVDRDIKRVGGVSTHWFEQPTNGITHVRFKINLKNLPEKLRQWVPMFCEIFQNIGTKNYKYDDFNDKLLSVSNGIEIRIDKFSTSLDDRNEQLVLSAAFLDRNIDKGFEYLAELLATPNFDEPSLLSDVIKMESVNKANNMGNQGLQYAISYAQSALKSYARSFETLRSDIFLIQFATEILKTSNPLPLLKEAVYHLTDIASYAFSE